MTGMNIVKPPGDGRRSRDRIWIGTERKLQKVSNTNKYLTVTDGRRAGGEVIIPAKQSGTG